jgi:hypothetical protein
MQSDQRFPMYVGGGNLWEEPIPAPLTWWQWLIQAITFDLVRPTW